jgi:uncharacterized membrane protein YqgA involved in biofilm formation
MPVPIGIISSCLAVALGGLIGAILTDQISGSLKMALQRMFGLTAMTLGIHLIARGENLSPIILSLIIGDILGELADIDGWLRRGTEITQAVIFIAV